MSDTVKLGYFRESSVARQALVSSMALLALYLPTALLGLELVAEAERIALFWPANGIALGFLLVSARQAWPALLIAAFIANAFANGIAGNALAPCLGFATANAFEVWLGAMLLMRISSEPFDLSSVRQVLALLGVAAVAASASGAIGALVPVLLMGAESYFMVWRLWMVADMVGLIAVTPVVLTWSYRQRGMPQGRPMEAVALAGVFVASLYVVFFYADPDTRPHMLNFPANFVIPLMLYAAVRFGPRGAATANLLVTLNIVVATVYTMGPFSDPAHTLMDRVFAAQAFIGTCTLSSLAIAGIIAQRRLAELQVREKQHFIHRVLDTSPDVIYVYDYANRKVLFTNRKIAEVLGYTLDELARMGVEAAEALMHPDDQKRLPELLARWQTARDGQVFETEYRIRHRDGSWRWILSRATVFLRGADGAPQQLLGIASDVTARKQVEEQLRGAKDKAEQASRAKDDFIATLSHELRTPLTPALIALDALATDSSLSAQARDDLAMIRRNILLETRLIDDLLDLSRIVNGKMNLSLKQVEVHAILTAVAEMIQDELRDKRLELAWDLGALTDCVVGDSARIHQVFWNVLKNAVKFTPDGGHINVVTRHEQNSLVVEVCDTGIGISRELLSRVFNPFEQGSHDGQHSFGGLGLGLAIAKAVTEMHGGQIAVHSDGPGRGSCFTITLPLSGAAQPDATGANPRGSDALLKALRVLVVDDHLDTLSVLSRVLGSQGMIVTTANSLHSAFTLIDSQRFDLVLSDIGLPDGTGHELMRYIRSRYPKLPGIAITGYGMDHDVNSSAHAGFSVHFTKPLDLDALKSAIRELAQQGAERPT